MDTFFPTSTLPSADVPNDRDDLIIQIDNLTKDRDRLQMNFDAARSRNEDLIRQINNVRGHIMDIYSMNGELDEDIKEIARMLDITLTKRIQGEANLRITYTAEVPLDFDTNDFELSYEINCESWDADNFEFDEDYFEYETGDED